jgi:hypothetical protein
LAADWIERSEDNYLLVESFLHYRFKSGTERERRFSSSGPTAEGDDPNIVIK